MGVEYTYLSVFCFPSVFIKINGMNTTMVLRLCFSNANGRAQHFSFNNDSLCANELHYILAGWLSSWCCCCQRKVFVEFYFKRIPSISAAPKSNSGIGSSSGDVDCTWIGSERPWHGRWMLWYRLESYVTLIWFLIHNSVEGWDCKDFPLLDGKYFKFCMHIIIITTWVFPLKWSAF